MSVTPALTEQLAYYRAIANEYHTHQLDEPGQDQLLAAVDGFRPTGDVLELACGRGVWTAHLLGAARSVTAVDGAPEMLAVARDRVGAAPVTFIEADLFSWRPELRYDAVFFGFWLSHVPDNRFESFWSMVADALTADGEVFFVDDHHRGEEELIEGPSSSVVERKLHDGTAFRAIKVVHEPPNLERRLRELGWNIAVTASDGPFYWGRGRRA